MNIFLDVEFNVILVWTDLQTMHIVTDTLYFELE